jgi:hypothetical protein
LNRRITVLQTVALPLGYAAIFEGPGDLRVGTRKLVSGGHPRLPFINNEHFARE